MAKAKKQNKEHYLPFEVVVEQLEAFIELVGPKYAARRLAKQNNKTVVDTQEPTGIKAAILHASLIGLLVIICSAMAVAFPGNA